MHKIKILALFLTIVVAYGCNRSILSSHSPPSYPQSDTQLCDIATSIKLDGTVVWSTKLPKYVSKAKSKKLDCLSKNTAVATTKTKASVAIHEYTDGYICKYAYDKEKRGLRYSYGFYKHYLIEVERRGINCSEIISSSEKGLKVTKIKTLTQKNTSVESKVTLSPSYYTSNQLCNVATTKTIDGTLEWNYNRPTYISEAKARNLNCFSPMRTNNSTEVAVVVPTQSSKVKKIPSPHDVAIIIGNSDYRRNGQDIPNVLPAKNDALAFKNFAQNHLGISSKNIIHIDDATTSQLERIFGNNRSHKGNAYNWVRPNKSKLYVYYAGHGAPGDDGTAYLVPSDASANSIDINGYPISTLYANLSKIPSKSTTVILESCFSGNSPSGSVINNASPVYQKANDISIPSNLTVITAGSMNQLASWTPDKKHGLFTYHYIKGMSGDADGPDYGNQDGDVSMNELQAYLDDNVTYYARRHYGRDQNVQISLAE